MSISVHKCGQFCPKWGPKKVASGGKKMFNGASGG